MSKKLKNVVNEKRTVQKWNMARKTEKCCQCEMQTLRLGICQKKVKACKMRNEHSRTRNMMRKLKKWKTKHNTE